MNRKKKDAIKNRDGGRPTPYYPAGRMIKIPDVGALPSLLKLLDEDGDVENTFNLSAVTADFIYYLDEEGGVHGTVMLNRAMQLVSDNFLADNDLSELVETNTSFLWISKDVKYWQREQYVRPHLLTPEIKKAVLKIDIEKLTDAQKATYRAYLNGPASYSKTESLMAVITISELSGMADDHLAPIIELIKKHEQ
jgi:hypothetical protein